LNPGEGGGANFFAPDQTGPGSHPASMQWVTGKFPELKRPGRGVDHYPQLAPKLKKEYNCISTPLLGLRGLF